MEGPLTCPQTVEELDQLASEPSREVVAMLEKTEGDLMVLGAGGKMGFHLAAMLRRGLDITGTSREVIAVSRFGDAEVRSSFESAGIRTLSADLTSEDELTSLPDASAVFFLAGKKFGTAGRADELRLYNEEMPRLVARRFRNAKIVALSTGCVYPFVSRESGGSVEEDTPEPPGDYAQSCLGRELAFEEESERYGTPISLIRLNYSVDLRYGVLVDLALRILAGEPVDIAMGWFNCIWQGDAVAHIIRALEIASAAPKARILNVTGSRILSVRESATVMADRLGCSVSFSGTETETAWLNNAGKAHRLFGAPRVSEDQLLEWVAEWVGQGRPILGKPTHFEVRDGAY